MTLENVLILSGALFSIGIYGVLSRRNFVTTIMSLEIMFNSIVIAAVAFSRFTPASLLLHSDSIVTAFDLHTALSGQVFGVFIIAIAAAESALALAIVFVLFRIRSSIEITEIDDLKG